MIRAKAQSTSMETLSFRPQGEILYRSLSFVRDDGAWPVTLRSRRFGRYRVCSHFGQNLKVGGELWNHILPTRTSLGTFAVNTMLGLCPRSAGAAGPDLRKILIQRHKIAK